MESHIATPFYKRIILIAYTGLAVTLLLSFNGLGVSDLQISV
jgi:hypothetical protein